MNIIITYKIKIFNYISNFYYTNPIYNVSFIDEIRFFQRLSIK